MALDPYHSWLGIRPEEQPPTLYRLLGLAPFEDNADVIDSAADRQMAHVRTFQSGKHALLSQRLLAEIAAARICLVDPAKRAEYNSQIRAKMVVPLARAAVAMAETSPLPELAIAPPPVQVVEENPANDPADDAMPPLPRRQKSLPLEIAKIIAGGLAGIALSVLLLRFVFGMDITGLLPISPQPSVAVKNSAKPRPQPEESPPLPSPSASEVKSSVERTPPAQTPAPAWRDYAVLLLPFDEGDFNTAGESPTVRDRSHRQQTGTVVGATLVAGKVGHGLYFDGIDDYVEFPADADDRATTALSICLWARPEAWVHPSDAADYLVSQDDWRRGAHGFVLRFAAGGQADFTIGTGRQWSEVRDSERQAIGNWVHLVAVYDGQRKTLYINGVSVASHPETQPIAPSSFALRIGRGKFAPKRGFHGVLDEIVVAHSAFSASDIQEVFDLGVHGLAITNSNMR